MGGPPTPPDDGYIHGDFRGPRKDPVRWRALSSFCAGGAAALDVICRGPDPVHNQHGHQCKHYDKGILPPLDHAAFEHHLTARGLCSFVYHSHCDDGVYGFVPTLNIIFLPLFLLLALATSLGVGLWLSALNVRYRDFQYTVPFLIQIWMFASPVVYASSLIPESLRMCTALTRWRA